MILAAVSNQYSVSKAFLSITLENSIRMQLRCYCDLRTAVHNLHPSRFGAKATGCNRNMPIAQNSRLYSFITKHCAPVATMLRRQIQ